MEALNDDLNTPQALAIVWEMIKSNIPSGDKYDLAMNFDEVLGLELSMPEPELMETDEVKELRQRRDQLRKQMISHSKIANSINRFYASLRSLKMNLICHIMP